MFNSPKEKTGILICLMSAIVFGIYPAAARVVYDAGGNVTFVILSTTFCRLAGLYGLAVFHQQKIFQNFKEYKTSLYAGAFQVTSIIGILGATYFMPGAIVIVIVFTHSLMLLLFSAWRKHIQLHATNVMSTLVALIGVALVLDIGQHGIHYPIQGIVLASMAAIATFARVYIFGRQSLTRHPLVTGSETFVIAFLLLLLLVFWDCPEFPHSIYGMSMAGLAALSLTLGSFGMFYGICCQFLMELAAPPSELNMLTGQSLGLCPFRPPPSRTLFKPALRLTRKAVRHFR